MWGGYFFLCLLTMDDAIKLMLYGLFPGVVCVQNIYTRLNIGELKNYLTSTGIQDEPERLLARLQDEIRQYIINHNYGPVEEDWIVLLTDAVKNKPDKNKYLWHRELYNRYISLLGEDSRKLDQIDLIYLAVLCAGYEHNEDW